MMKVLIFLLVGLTGFVQRAGCEHTFSFTRTPEPGIQRWSNCHVKGRGKYWVEGKVKTIWKKESWIWSEDEVNGGGMAKADGIFASKFSV
jgi:hypothetical protein